jgi:CubicO group peptidase (beta-lactamase class C family)
MQHKMYIYVLLLIACSILSGQAQSVQIAKLPDTAAGRQLSAYIAAVNAGDEKVMRSFLESHTSERVLERVSVERIAAMERKSFEEFGGYELRKVLESKDYSIRVLLQAKKGQLINFTLDVEQSAPHKIMGANIQPAEPQDNNEVRQQPPIQPQGGPPPLPDENAFAIRRLNEFIRVVNTGDRAVARSFIRENFSNEFLKIPMDVHLDFISKLFDRTRGVEFAGIQGAKPNEVTALLRNKLTGGWEALIFRVEPDAPNKISAIGLERPNPPSDPQLEKKITEKEMVASLDTFLQKLAAADVFSGAVLLAKNGQTLFKKAYGQADKDFNAPNRTDTKFNLGSMNKMFTAVAIAQLVEKGKLSFDAPLSKYLSAFPNKEAAEKIKIKHLLTHTSGLGNYFNRRFNESSKEQFRTINDLLELARSESLAFEPGSRWAYSNTGFLVLGAVIEKVTGQSYYDYVRENIYRRAGMTNSDAYDLDLVNPNLAVGYEKEFTEGSVRFRNNLFKHVIKGGPAGGGYSTVEDLLKFDVALRSNKLVSAEYTKLLLAPKPELNSPKYGYGFGIDTEHSIAGHSGGFTGISSNLDMFLANGYTAVVMSNYSGAALPVVEKIRELAEATANRP